MAYSQVAIYGMNAKVGLVSYPNEEGSFNKPYSNETARMIDDEVRKMVQLAYERTTALLEEKKSLVTALAETLLQKDVSLSTHKSSSVLVVLADGLQQSLSKVGWLLAQSIIQLAILLSLIKKPSLWRTCSLCM